MNITEGFALVLLWCARPHQWKWWCLGRICPTAPWSAPHPRSAGTGDPWTPHTAAGTHCWSLHEYWGNASVYSSESAGRNTTWQSVKHNAVRVITGMCWDDVHLCVRKRRLGQIHLRLLVLTQPSTQTQTARERAIIEQISQQKWNITMVTIKSANSSKRYWQDDQNNDFSDFPVTIMKITNLETFSIWKSGSKHWNYTI